MRHKRLHQFSVISPGKSGPRQLAAKHGTGARIPHERSASAVAESESAARHAAAPTPKINRLVINECPAFCAG